MAQKGLDMIAGMSQCRRPPGAAMDSAAPVPAPRCPDPSQNDLFAPPKRRAAAKSSGRARERVRIGRVL